MPIQIEGYQFSGPFYHTRRFSSDFGCVYLIINSKNQIIDVGETGDTNSRIINHERKMCWYNNGVGETGLYIYINNDENFRRLLEKLIRNKYQPVCGIK
jgi:hypothetical protein